jgi:N-sulfoglucosamine sulfohydrolase
MRIKVLSLLLLLAWTGLTAEPGRPNILFCIADDWAWPHAGIYGDKVVHTPNFDRIAREGILFTHAFSAAPSCTPSRAAILTGQAPHRLKEGGNLWGFLPKEFPVFPDRLEQAGYAIGHTRKGWGPGNFKAGGRSRNPAGPQFKSFAEFFKAVPKGKPFYFWFGSQDPHRPYDRDSGLKAGLNLANVQVPPYWPDTPEVRRDILDYYYEVERFDRDVGEILKLLEAAGQLDQTLIVITGDNGSPFPRCKANLYDGGTRQPLAIRWPGKAGCGRVDESFVNLTDFAPTLLEAAGLQPSPEMTGRSLMPIFSETALRKWPNALYLERERHANVRKGDVGYPSRAIRTKDFLYIRNFHPERWPAGDPEKWVAVGAYGDCDNGPTKEYILAHRDEPGAKQSFELAFGRRPAEELYDLKNDPHQMTNVAMRAEFVATRQRLDGQLQGWMRDTADPRATGGGDSFDTYPYFGDKPRL